MSTSSYSPSLATGVGGKAPPGACSRSRSRSRAVPGRDWVLSAGVSSAGGGGALSCWTGRRCRASGAGGWGRRTGVCWLRRSRSSISRIRASRAESSLLWVLMTCFLPSCELPGSRQTSLGGQRGLPLVNLLVEVGDAVLNAEDVHQLLREGTSDSSVESAC